MDLNDIQKAKVRRGMPKLADAFARGDPMPMDRPHYLNPKDEPPGASYVCIVNDTDAEKPPPVFVIASILADCGAKTSVTNIPGRDCPELHLRVVHPDGGGLFLGIDAMVRDYRSKSRVISIKDARAIIDSRDR